MQKLVRIQSEMLKNQDNVGSGEMVWLDRRNEPISARLTPQSPSLAINTINTINTIN